MRLARHRERREVGPALAPGVAPDAGRAGAAGVQPIDRDRTRAGLVLELVALAVQVVELHERVHRAVQARQLLAVAPRVPRRLVACVCVDEAAVERDPHGLAVGHLRVVQVELLGAAVADATDLLALRNGLALGQRRQLLEVEVVGDPAVAVVEIDAVAARVVREDLEHVAVGRREHRLALAHVGVGRGPLTEVDAVLVGPVAFVGRRLPGLTAGERASGTSGAGRRPRGRGGDQRGDGHESEGDRPSVRSGQERGGGHRRFLPGRNRAGARAYVCATGQPAGTYGGSENSFRRQIVISL